MYKYRNSTVIHTQNSAFVSRFIVHKRKSVIVQQKVKSH